MIKCEMRLQKTLTKLFANYSTHKIGKYVTLTLNYFWHFHLNIFWSNRIFFVNILWPLDKCVRGLSFKTADCPNYQNSLTKAGAKEVKKCPKIYDISMNDFWFTYSFLIEISHFVFRMAILQMRFIKGVHSDASVATCP